MRICAILSMLMLITACGSSSSGGGSGEGPGGDVKIHGLLQTESYAGAVVCFDTDNDYGCGGETSVNVNNDGSFAIEGSTEYPLVVVIPSSLKASGNLVLSAPAGETVISSLTTLVRGELDRHPYKSIDSIISDMGLTEDPFDKGNNLKSTAIKAEKALSAMISAAQSVLGADFKFSNALMILLASEIVEQLKSGADFDNIDDQLPPNLEGELENIENNKPVFKTFTELVADGKTFDWYIVGYRWDQFSDYLLYQQSITQNGYFEGERGALSHYRTAGTMPGGDPDGDRADIGELLAQFEGWTVINISGQTLQTTPYFKSQSIANFPNGSYAYVVKSKPFRLTKDSLPTVSDLKELYKDNNGWWDNDDPKFNYLEDLENCDKKDHQGPELNLSIITCSSYTLTLNWDTNLFTYKAKNNGGLYYTYEPFVPDRAAYGGSFESFGEGDEHEMYLYNNNGSVFVYFGEVGDVIATFMVDVPDFSFNKTAAEHIRDNFNTSIIP